jgi:acetyltransferase-like isoleucine patch superfamily enzyme/acyl carrier protein
VTALEQDVRAYVLAHVAEPLHARGLGVDDVPDGFDLLAEEVIDSFALLELIGEVERRFGVELDFENLDADDLTAVGPFSRFVAASAGAGAAASEQEPPPSAGEERAVPVGEQVAPRLSPSSVQGAVAPRRLLGRAALRAYVQGTRLRDKLFSLAVGGGFRAFGAHTVVQMPVRLKNAHRIAVGRDGFIGAGSWLQAIEAEGGGPAIEIGDGASFAGHTVISASASVRIGRNVSLARNVYISDVAHAYDDPSLPVLEQGTTSAKPIEIGDSCWLGENVTVLPGVRIGEGAVVGANSVVAGDVPPHCLAIGSPARVVRRFAAREG